MGVGRLSTLSVERIDHSEQREVYFHRASCCALMHSSPPEDLMMDLSSELEFDLGEEVRLLEVPGTGGTQFVCSFEVVQGKTGAFDARFEWARVQYEKGQEVQLLAHPELFREAFYRFDGDKDGNDWSLEKTNSWEL